MIYYFFYRIAFLFARNDTPDSITHAKALGMMSFTFTLNIFALLLYFNYKPFLKQIQYDILIIYLIIYFLCIYLKYKKVLTQKVEKYSQKENRKGILFFKILFFLYIILTLGSTLVLTI